MGFTTSRIDLSMWYKLKPNGKGYDYIAHHVDDFLIVADEPAVYLKEPKKVYSITGGEIPKLYLGQTTIPLEKEFGWCLSTEKYIKKCLNSICKIINKPKIGMHTTPTVSEWHPELYSSPLLDDAHIKIYQQLIGMGVWLTTIGRIDIAYAISTLSRFTRCT